MNVIWRKVMMKAIYCEVMMIVICPEVMMKPTFCKVMMILIWRKVDECNVA